ncbi:MAG: ABC transporter permease [Prevotellaceae bacterium]|jgi:ABC-type antimicrobial peptide transport system permease subunit|nr:ABC transporter permease [Prevotellaceae bacterium]
MYSFKIAFRNLKRNGLYSWINIVGLSIGLSICILLALWIQNELSFDHFHKNADRIYRLNADIENMGYWTTTPAPVAPMALENNPEVREYCRVERYFTDFFEHDGRKFFGIKSIAVDTDFFTFFDFRLREGSADNPFQDDLSLIVSESKAKILFGEEDPIGKVVKDGNGLLFHVVGVVEDAPDNSSVRFDFILPRLVVQKTFRGNWIWKHIDDDWGSYRYQTFFLLHNDADPDALAKKISSQVTTVRSNEKWFEDEEEEENSYVFVLQPLKKIHLYEADGSKSSDLRTLYLLVVIMVFILLIACINYVNIVTARAAKRSREIAMRKIMGANKSELFFQLLLETFLLLLFALIIASLLIYVLIPTYNVLAGKNLVFSFTNSTVLLAYAIMAVSTMALAGLYPALSLLSFNPLDAFRSYISGKKRESFLRKGLVVLQFAISVALITSTLTIGEQIRYMRKKDLGYDKENIFTTRAGNMREHYDVARNELLKNSEIVDVTGSGMVDMAGTSSRGGTFWPGKPNDYDPTIYTISIVSNFTEVMNIEILEGEPLYPQDSFAILINEEAKRIMKMDNPIGKPFYMNKGSKEFYTIKGVVKNFNFEQLDKRIGPLVISNDSKYVGGIYIKVRPGGAKSAVETAEKLWKQYNADYDFQYTFLEDAFDKYYKKEIYLERMLLFFTAIVVFISCVGMFGLATYSAETRTKEIGVRKTLGASISGIVQMLSKEFVALVCLGFVIGFPVAYYFMDEILQYYAYRISITWWMIAIVAVVIFALAILTVSGQAIRAARANPVKAIKTE